MSALQLDLAGSAQEHVPIQALIRSESEMPYIEFKAKFSLGGITTEKLHPKTMRLSHVMHENVISGMELLLEVDCELIASLEKFIPSIEPCAQILAARLVKGGRIFLVGSGTSGRVGIDIAQKCVAAFPETAKKILGVIAGGDSALVRAKEGFEDSESDGEKALAEDGVGLGDTVILISASGSASFNVGCGHFAANKGASVLYFYNSEDVPDRTQALFTRKNNPIIPLLVDSGPQAVAGSTRLQGATLAEACLGSLLGSALYLSREEHAKAKSYPEQIKRNLICSLGLIRQHLEAIANIARLEKEVLSHPSSNFRKIRDENRQGYITFLAGIDSIREVLIDATETSPTFSTNPIRRESEINKRRAEFHAYLEGVDDNAQAWEALLGRKVYKSDRRDVREFILSSEAEGVNTYVVRPTWDGNLVVGVAKIKGSEPIFESLLTRLKECEGDGGRSCVILICNDQLTEEQRLQLKDLVGVQVILEGIQTDELGFSETIALKLVLNMISNSSMVLMNKVHGNQMIDVRAANLKLIDRCIRLTKSIWSEYRNDIELSDRTLYEYILDIKYAKESKEIAGFYTPSVVKIVLAMLSLGKMPCDFDEVVQFLIEREENIDSILRL